MIDIDSLGLNKDYILNKVSEYQIFSFYCKNFKEINKPFLSEFYADSKPDCRIFISTTGLMYKDFGEPHHYFNCFGYVMQKFSCTYIEALKIIANDFGIIKMIKDFKVTPSANYVGLPDKQFGNSKTILKVKFRDWYPKIDTYFYDYYIAQKTLDLYLVKAISHYWLNKKYLDELFLAYDYTKNVFDPAYSYEEGEDFRKILRPYNKEYKWVSNVPRRYYQGYKQLDNFADILLITSSLKDVMVWKTFGINAICPTGESTFLTDNAFELLKYRFKNIFINFDSDKDGRIYSKKYSEQFNLKEVFIPDYKDISDYIYFRGYFETQQLITNLF